MANYIGTSRTNYFRVTNEQKYNELINNLICEDNIHDFTEERNGILYHGFGAYDSIEYMENEYDDYDFNKFLKELQKILPDNEAFIYFEAGHENLRYVSGFVLVCTNKEIKSMSLDVWAKEQAKKLLGSDFETQTSY